MLACAPLPRPPAAAIQWQLYFSACDGCFEIKFAKVQTIHSMINDCSGREQQHLASEQRKSVRSGTQNVFIIHLPAETTAGRVFATVLNIHNKINSLEDNFVTEGRRIGTLYPPLDGHSAQSAPGSAAHPGAGMQQMCKPQCKCGVLSLKVHFHHNKCGVAVRVKHDATLGPWAEN